MYNTLSTANSISLNEYIKKEKDDNHLKVQVVEDLEKILEDFSNDINTTKDTIKNLFLDVEASFEEVSDDIAKSVSKYSFSAEEKLNILDGITRQFVENNRSFIYNSSESKKIVEREAFKKVCDLILNKLKILVQLNTINNYHILLKFGRGNVKKETLETVKNDSNISDELRKEFLKYNRMKNQDVKVTELINFMTPIYDKLTSQLNHLIRELSMDLNKILQ
ncbi:sporozoite protein essential for cell traversal, putative [Plasmodium ovale curtisi]|uniref:Sporozoite protein essential for cell traversal, putative n=1 Tax=Plasmodium ovale curtisi TaxID=864141 RepID=A0A1A8W1R6_PLAOA|nr:sporozoite protein essential for cell traversal, putative [Plasmodium ovale curtisi]SBS96188.1 sporozoite protein essential for cell traversal, putative [Plasmodium ovale curtisi]